MDLPTYTNIWRIEKRLYKLYDFRLPMPLPVGQIAVFLAIAVPYVLVLSLLGLPFSHTLLWVYVLPPGVLAWLTTRPVLEGKRLPELIASQVRYVLEPRTWCRLAPLAEKDEIVFYCRVWRQADPVPEPQPATESEAAVAIAPGRQQRVAWPVTTTPGPRPWQPSQRRPAQSHPAEGRPAESRPSQLRPSQWRNAEAQDRPGGTASGGTVEAGVSPTRPARPVVTVTGDRTAERPLRVVERALRRQPVQRPDGWRDRVVVVPGGHRPGQPDQVQRDRARARLPVDGPRRIVVLGCTRGAGQTTTVLLTGDMLASLRGQPVAVLDLNPGRGSLTERAAAIPGLVRSPSDARAPGTAGHVPPADGARQPDSGVQVISASAAAATGGDDAGRILDLVAARYSLTLADPAAGCVPRTLQVADQLLIVAPASVEAPGALAMTFEWLEAHGHGRLATTAITVLNGVSGPTQSHVDQAATVASGRCRAIVKVPWDSNLKELSQERAPAPASYSAAPVPPAGAHSASADAAPAVLAAPTGHDGASLLSPALTQAYTALAGVLIAGLADPDELRSARL